MRRYLAWILPSVTLLPFICLFGALACKVWSEKKIGPSLYKISSSSPQSAVYQSHSLKRFSLGFDNLISGIIWVRLIQKADTHAIQKGEVSWEYAQIDAVTTLDPNFEQAYGFGAISLSVFRQDKMGALLLLEKWVRHRPQYWKAHYLLGYHLYYELGNFSRGSKELLAAAGMPRAPSYLNALGIRLLSETGALAQALKISLELYPSVRDAEGKYRLVRRVRSLNFALQRAAWESGLGSYKSKYHKAPDGLKDVASFVVSEIRSVASIVDDIPADLASVVKEKFAFKYDKKKGQIEPADSMKEMDLEGTGIFLHGHGRNSTDTKTESKESTK
jgi:hypothetical protein